MKTLVLYIETVKVYCPPARFIGPVNRYGEDVELLVQVKFEVLITVAEESNKITVNFLHIQGAVKGAV